MKNAALMIALIFCQIAGAAPVPFYRPVKKSQVVGKWCLVYNEAKPVTIWITYLNNDGTLCTVSPSNNVQLSYYAGWWTLKDDVLTIKEHNVLHEKTVYINSFKLRKCKERGFKGKNVNNDKKQFKTFLLKMKN